MPLNKLDNFIKNTEGRILYVNPNDLDATDSIDNQGNSLARPFKTIQRALLEAARFSWIKGYNNDIVEKTTILLFPGVHTIDNRPGWGIYDNSGAKAVSRSTAEYDAASIFSLGLDSNFDLTQEDNILYKFNSWYGGVVVPRGTSIVGLDLRKTKIRPKYVPNPTDANVDNSAIFRVTGACYFWQFSLFDADASSLAYTNPNNFGGVNLSTPNFSHHKLTCFEFCDGVNKIILPINGSTNTGLTDLDMYYSKVSNAFNTASGRDIDEKYPSSPNGFAKRNPEWEIVGAFASDPISISNIISGDGTTPSSIVTVTTTTDHGLNAGTPIKIKGVGDGTALTQNYNISTTVQTVLSSTSFTYLLPALQSYIGIAARPTFGGATVTVETDTVSGASPYIFNCSLRSVWGMNGLHADGRKASGFRSTVVAQFTAVSLQKDDRAFAKYNTSSRTYEKIDYSTAYGSDLSDQSSQKDKSVSYHLDPDAVYRQGWESSHIKISNDAFIQIVSVFAIGFNKHFDAQTGGDASITNSNSNFGQISLSSSGFKKEAFTKDNKAFITSIIPPRAITASEGKIDWITLDVNLTSSTVGVSSHLYLYGYTSPDNPPTAISQGYRIGARTNDKLYIIDPDGIVRSASIYMCDNLISDSVFTVALGSSIAVKSYRVTTIPSGSTTTFTIGANKLLTGEKVKIISDDGDLPENIDAHKTYYAINVGDNNTIRLASSYTNAIQSQPITVSGGTNLTILSRVSDKNAGDIGSPIQYDAANQNWFIHVDPSNDIYSSFGLGGYGEVSDVSYVKRISDDRSLDEKLYKIRVVIPKELGNAKDPESGFILQESSSTGVTASADFTRTSIGRTDYGYNKNLRLISNCSVSSGTVTVIAELPHNMQVGELVIIRNVKCSQNTTGEFDKGYNGRFVVTEITNANTFKYSTVDFNGISHSPGTFTVASVSVRDTSLPRFERNDWGGNLFIYRNEIISPYIQDKQDGIYHLYVLNANNQISVQFTNLKFGQLTADLYPQLDRDNIDDNPRAAKTYAKRSPIGEVVTNDLKKSITRESIDLLLKEIGNSLTISSISSSTNSATLSFSRFHGLSGIVTGTRTAGGAGYTPGTYYNVKLLNSSQTGTWNGATANVVVSGGGDIISASIAAPGSGYSGGLLYFDAATVGNGNNSAYNTTLSGISTNIGDIIQVTGIGTVADGYYRITSVPSSTTVSIAKTPGDPQILAGQYMFVVGTSIKITSSSYNSTTGYTTFVTTAAHGLLKGNKFRVIDSSNNNLGDYVVKDKVSVTSFTALTNQSISASNGYILKHGLSANGEISDATGESLGSRAVSFYDNETFTLNADVTDGTTITITASGIGTAQRLPLGSYVQIDSEIMRVVSSNNTTQATVVRGIFGTVQETHKQNSLVRKINPIAIEFRRPSIIRASGHTFEYLGYGPGNYSTGLPQVQVKTLSEPEQFFSQAQERSGGVVVYTGMNNNGDFFNGNTKTSASSGLVVSYDIPKPSVTGEASNKSIATFDEVTIKERILVEGGTSGQILSQFDGPVTFNKDVRLNGNILINGTTKFTDNLNVSESITIGGELTVNTGISPDTDLGAYLGKSSKAFSEAYIGKIRIAKADDYTIDTSTGNLKLSAPTGSVVAIQTNTTVSGKLSADYLDVPNISPIGSIMMWPGGPDTWPTANWALCNGQAISRTTYSELFTLIGTTYGSGDGLNTFNLPDIRERFVVGAGGGDNPNVSGSPYALGQTGGKRDATLVEHIHDINDPGHAHNFIAAKRTANSQNGTDDTECNNQSLTTDSATTGITIKPAGSSATDANLPPFIGLSYIIRIK
jgi:microcystin-dependent protein